MTLTLRGTCRSHATGSRAISRRAAAWKQRSFCASSHTSLQSSGTRTGAQLPFVLCAPMSRFHPPFTLTGAHRPMRLQLRSVHGAITHIATATTATAAVTRFRNAPSARDARIDSRPSAGASASDCGLTRVQSPITTPAATSHAARGLLWLRLATTTHAQATSRSDAVTPSVMSAAVYGTSTGWSANTSAPTSAPRVVAASRSRTCAPATPAAPTTALTAIAAHTL